MKPAIKRLEDAIRDTERRLGTTTAYRWKIHWEARLAALKRARVLLRDQKRELERQAS